MNTLQIAVCEDLDTDAVLLTQQITGSGIPAEISRFESGEALLAAKPAGRFDLIFLDIYMKGITGIEAAHTLRRTDEDCGIVFTTTSEAHLAEAFDVGAEQYLVKPVQREKLLKLLRSRVEYVRRSRKSCTVNIRGHRAEIPFDRIYYIEVYGHNCQIHTSDGVLETGSSMTIDDFLSLLPVPRFLRCHKSYIVNMSYVRDISRDFIMKNGHTVYIRRGDVKKCAAALDRWRLYEAGRES